MKKYHWPRRVLSLLLCLVLAIGFFPAGAIDRAEAATGYVTDNLVLHLDANNNTGSGFDANATTWKNLAPGGESIKINGQTWGTDATYGSKYLSFSNNYIILPESVREAIGGENFTVEFVMDNYTSKDDNNIINVMAVTGDDQWLDATTAAGSTPNDNFVLFVTKGETNIKFRTAWWDATASSWNIMATSTSKYARADGSAINGKTNTLTYDHDGYSYYYVDGVQATNGKSQNADSKTVGVDGFLVGGKWQTERKPQVVFGACCDTVKSRSFHGNVKAIRIYKDVLTAEEAAQNAAADKANYYTEQKPATIAVPEGYVTDNLVFFVDANLNTGTGYDANATEWVDLTDATGATKVKTNGNTWGTDTEYETQYLAINNNYILLPDEVRQAIAGENFTVEFIMDDYTASDTNNIINVMCVTGDDAWIKSMTDAGSKGSVVNDNFVLFVTQSTASKTETAIKFRTAWWDNGWNIMAADTGSYARADGTTVNGKTNTLTYDHDGYSYYYLDGVQTSTGASQNMDSKTISLDGFKINGTWQTERKPQVAFGAATDTIKSRSFNGKVKAIRIYSDVLTQQEAAQNAAMDYSRYYVNDGAGHTHIWDTEWTTTASHHWQKCTVSGCEEQRNYGAHAYSNNDDASCNTCGYNRPIKSPVASYDVDLYEPVTDVNTAPIIMQDATASIKDVSGEAKRPSAMIFELKVESGVLNAYSGETKLGAWADLYAANCKKANVGARLSDQATATALANWVATERAANLWVISNDVELIKTVTDVDGRCRGVVDFTGDSVRGPANIKFNFDTDGDGTVENKTYADAPNKVIGGEMANNATRTYEWKTYTKGDKATVYENMEWNDIYDLVFAEGYRTIIISDSVATNDQVYFLQGSLVYTIVETDAAAEKDIYDVIVSGPNAIITSGNYADYIGVLEGDLFDVDGKNILVRGGSLVGHRGDMGYAVKGEKTVPENSIESIVSAAQSGASSVEFDMYLTLDGELVLNHNASIKGYFEYGPNTPDNITRISDSVGIKERYWYGDMEYLVSSYNTEIPMQRLQDLYEAVDNEYPELRLHHEIKDSRVECLNRTIEMMDEYGLRGRSDMMCFTRSTVAYTTSMGVSSQYLSSVSKYGDSDRAYTMENQYRDLNSTWHATWSDITNSTTNTEFLEEMKHFGQTAYPWPTSSVTTQAAYYVAGYQGFTTNIPHDSDDYIRELVATYNSTTGTVTAVANTLADHAKGTPVAKSDRVPADYEVVTLPDYLEKWWIAKGKASGVNVYTIDKDLEIVVLEGAENVVVNNGVVTKKSGAASGEATIAVRYLQKIGNSAYYTYSRAIEIDALSYDHDHAWDTTAWESNDTHHWHPCTAAGCMETVPANMDGYAEHTYANDTDLTCDCGYVRKVAKVPAGYETDGLVLFLDGIDNVATGTHSNTSDVWVNLASIGQQIALPDGSKHVKVDSEWGSDYLDLDGYIKLPESVRQVIASGEFTIEFVMDDFAVNSVDTQNIMTLTGSDAWIEANKAAPVAKPKNDNFVIYQNAWESNVNFKINTDGKPRAQLKNAADVNDKTNAITFKLGSKANWYQNASVVSTSNDTYTAAPDIASWDGTTPQVLFGAAVDTVQSRAFDAKVKAIRIYDRVLSADELTANALADETRYGQQLTGSNIPDGYAENGLVLFLDGLNNTGTGDHSTSAMKWVNLADRSEYATFLSGGSNSYVWNEDGMVVNGGVILPASALEAVAGSNFTLEFYVEDYDPTIMESVTRNFVVLIGPDGSVSGAGGGVWDDDFVSFQNSTTANPANDDQWCFDIKNTNSTKFGRISVGAGSINDVTNAIAFDKTKSVTWFQEGVSKSTQSGGASAGWTTGIDLTNGTRLLFGAASGYMNNRAFTGDVKAIRIYNRTLTADELKANAATDTYRYGDIDYEKEAQTSWDNVIGNTGLLDKNTTLAGVQAYAESQLSAPGAVEVSVADKGNGAFEFTYKVAGGDKILNTHTLYVDTEYTLDMSKMTADEQAKLLNDVVKFAGSGTIAVKWDDTAKALNYKGTRNGNPVSHLYFPVYASGDAYVFEAEIGFVSGGGTWSTMAFAAEGFVEHLQSAFWGTLSETSTAAEFVRFQDPAKNNNTFAVGHINTTFDKVLEAMGDKWDDTYTYDAEKEKYNVTDTVTYKVIVYDGVMYGFIDGVQVLEAINNGTISKDLNGVFGFNSGGSSLNIHSLSVRPITEENEDEELAGVDLAFNPIKSFKNDIYEPDTDINAAPIVMQTATEFVSDVSGLAKRPSAIIFDVKAESGVLKAYDGDKLLGNLGDLYKANQPKANVGVRIALGDTATAEALLEFIDDYSAGNLWVISNDTEILKSITDKYSIVRAVVDFTGDVVRGPANITYNFDTDEDGTVEDTKGADASAPNKVIGGEYADRTAAIFEYQNYTGGYEALSWDNVYDITIVNGYRTMLLPESAVTKEHVYSLHGSLMTVFVETEADSEIEFYDLIVTGVNGILSTEFDANLAALEGDLFDVNGENVLVRGGHVVGHRGDMGYHVKGELTMPENSIESVVSSAQGGSASVEFDMYLTLDGELVLNHNTSIAGYFVYGPNTPDNITRVADSVTIVNRYWYGDLEYMVSTYNSEIPMQRLQDLYEAIDTEYPELRLHHELKDTRIETINRTIELMDQYGLRSRSDMMCGNLTALRYINGMGVSIQSLSTPSAYNTENRIYAEEVYYRPINSTWHTTWGNINTDFLEEMKHYGQTAYPWPTSNPSTMAAYYVQGYQGFTTDIPHHTDDYIRELIPVFDPDTGKLTVTARTLAYHEPGSAVGKSEFVGDDYTVVTLPNYLQGWWENPECPNYISNTPNMYELSGYEVVVVSGDAVVNGDTITATEESVVLVRYKQTLAGGSTFWIYSQTFTVGGEKITGYDVTANADAAYDGTAKASATVTEGVPVDAEITFSWTDAAGQPQTSTTVPSFTEPGTYEVSYVISKDGYNDVTGSYQFTIEEGTLSGYEVKGNDAVTYDGNAHASAVVTVGTPADATITFEVGGTSSATVPSFTDAGTYTVNYTISKDNYVDITGSYTFTVDAAELDVELEKNEEVEYSGKPVPAIEEPELPEGVHFTFALFDSKAAAEEGEEPSKVFDEDEIPAFDKPGTYYLGVVIYDKDGNYEIIYDTVTLKITEPAPETGDTFNAGLWVGLLAASAVLAIALFVVLRRRKEQE